MRPFARLFTIVLLIGVIASLVGCGDEAVRGATHSVAADFRLASLDGAQLSPADYPDSVVLVEFWATWCGPCHVQASILSALYPEYKSRGVEFIAVSVGEPSDVVASFVEESPFPYPVLLDPDDRISVQLGIVGLPTVMVLDRNREVVYFSAGVADEETVRRALAGSGRLTIADLGGMSRRTVRSQRDFGAAWSTGSGVKRSARPRKSGAP